jgi:FkbM family methyltransferase
VSRLRRTLRAIILWPPLNRLLTTALRAALPARAKRHPAVARYVPRVGVVQAALPRGRVLRMRSRGDDDIASPLFWRGWDGHESETVHVFYELAGTAGVTLDVGAHVGYYALLAAHANPAGRVFAFEPMPRVRERLEGNIALNGAANVTCMSCALGSPAGQAEFFHVRDGIPSSSSLSRGFMQSIAARDELTSSTVDVLEGDAFAAAHGIECVDLVKLDTETTEPAVVAGMLGTLRRDRPPIICEVLDAQAARELQDLLDPLGYEYFLLTADGPLPRAHIRPDAVWPNYLFRMPTHGPTLGSDAPDA